MPVKDDDYFVCPICAEEVPINALACPGCGADDETGWSEDAEYDGVDLPDEAFDGSDRSKPAFGLSHSPLTKAVLILMILLIVMFIFARAF